MKLRTIFMSVLFTLSVSSCATSTTVADSADLNAKEAIASAEMARKNAAKVGYEWRDTGKIIASAKKLAAKGDNDKAIILANKAKDQATAALSQYEIEIARYAKNHQN